jgi:hypothetical protein
MTDAVTPDLIKSAVINFWALWRKKSSEEVIASYSSRSTAFRVESTRTEPGTLVARARAREYLHGASKIDINLGSIDAVVLGRTVGMATCTFSFRAEQRARPVQSVPIPGKTIGLCESRTFLSWSPTGSSALSMNIFRYPVQHSK